MSANVAAYLLLLSVVIDGTRAQLSDEEYYRLSPLFHLDEYERCLSQQDGLFCVGDFDLLPLTDPHPVYDKLREYSEYIDHFNYTVLHRGYCVSARCPDSRDERNATLRFEKCVARNKRPLDLHVVLRNSHHCETHAGRNLPAPIDTPMLIFLVVLLLLLTVNAVGTLYDVFTANQKKNSLLISWSVRENWRRLTSFKSGNELQPAQGLRVILLLLILLIHACLINFRLYLLNPREIEKFTKSKPFVPLKNSTGFVEVFIVLSSFLLAHNLLKDSRHKPVSLSTLPTTLIKRFIRISPVALLMVGFAATWWPWTGAGPLWQPLVGAESAVCRTKFWWHALYLHNLLDNENNCLVQTWFLAADMQLYVIMSMMTVALARLRRRALTILFTLFLAITAFNIFWAMKHHLVPVLYLTVPKLLHSGFESHPTLTQMYISPWGSTPAALAGLFLAHLQHKLQESDFQPHQHAWVRWACSLSLPALLLWTASGLCLPPTAPAWCLALYTALERSYFAIFIAIWFYGLFNKIGINYWRVLSWRGWESVARISLSVMMLHWCVNMNLVAGNKQAIYGTFYTCVFDAVLTALCTYLLAVPLTLAVEMPFVASYTALTRPSPPN